MSNCIQNKTPEELEKGCGSCNACGGIDFSKGVETEEGKKKPGAGYYFLVLVICIGAIVAASALAKFLFF